MRYQIDTDRRTPAAQPRERARSGPGDGLDWSLSRMSARSHGPTGGGGKLVSWLYDRWMDGGETYISGLIVSPLPHHHGAANSSPITHHRESAGTPTAPGSCGEGGGGGNDGCSSACPLTSTHFSAALEPRSGVALSSPSESAAVASVGSESSNSSSSSSSSSSSPSSSLDSTRSPSPLSICSGASGDVGVGKPIAGGGGGGGAAGNSVTQDGCEGMYRSELGRGISPRYARLDLFSSFFSSR
jgi:hypothetical protein